MGRSRDCSVRSSCSLRWRCSPCADAKAASFWLAALVFGVNYFSNVAARFLIPPLPFVALAMMLGVSAIPQLAVAIALLHCVLSWPALVPRYANHDAWRLARIPWKRGAAHQARRALPGIAPRRLCGRPFDRAQYRRPAPPSSPSRRFRRPTPRATSAWNTRRRPTRSRARFCGPRPARIRAHLAVALRAFRAGNCAALRVVQTATRRGYWSIHELRISGWRPRIAACRAMAPHRSAVTPGACRMPSTIRWPPSGCAATR